MSLTSNIANVVFETAIPLDLILGTYSGSFTVAAPTATAFPQKVSASTSFFTGITEKCFFQGIFSTDGGITWVDFNSNITKTFGAIVNLQTQMAYGSIKANLMTITGDNWNQTTNNITWTAQAYTFLYKVVLFAMPGQGNVTAQSFVQPLSFDSSFNYQKIFRDSVFPFNFPAGSNNTAVINHNLGYIPKIRSYVDNFTNNASDPVALYDFGYFISQQVKYQIYMDNNTVYIGFDNTAGANPMIGTLYTRIYYDS